MMIGRKRQPEQKSGAPAYIVSFSDMMTLLLAFFILLQIFASTRDPELFSQGRGSFVRALESFGMPGILLGREHRTALQGKRPSYFVEGPQDGVPTERVVDAEADRIAQMLDQLRKSSKVDPLVDEPRKPLVFVTPIRFARGKSKLSKKDRSYLTDLWKDMITSGTGDRIEIEIRGYAQEVRDLSARYAVAASRAAAVERALSEMAAKHRLDREWIFRSAGSAANLPRGEHELCVLVKIVGV